MELSREHILTEVSRIKYLYKMKGVFRYGQSRDPHQRAESNAEHLYGMMVLCNYFLPYEDPEGTMDKQRIYDLIMVHDIDEIESGDIISYEKTDEDRAQAQQDLETALETIPTVLHADYRALIREYEEQATPEARFTKALDKAEPSFEVFDRYGKELLHKMQTTHEQHFRNKHSLVEPYPVLYQFCMTIIDEMHQQGFFYEQETR